MAEVAARATNSSSEEEESEWTEEFAIGAEERAEEFLEDRRS